MPTEGKTKPFKTYEEQIVLLKSRGLIISNEEEAKEILKRMNYYRLSAYSLTLRKDDVFYPNVSIDDIVALYDFDADLRKIVFCYSSKAETAARAYIAYYHAKKYGPIGYLNNQHFEDERSHSKFLQELFVYINRSQEVFVSHYKEKYNGVYPIWVAVEEMTFGTISKFYKNMAKEDRQAISKEFYGISREYIENFMQCACVARNIAAHGGRFYNRNCMRPAVKLPKKLKIDNNRPGAYLYAIYMLLPECDKYSILVNLKRAFRKHGFAKPKYLGLPDNWFEIFEKMQ